MAETIPKKKNCPPPPPKGNKFAIGNKGGRPRTTSLGPDDMVQLGKEMIAWIKAHPQILHLSQWYCLEKCILFEEWEQYIRCPEFRIYYEQAIKLVGLKYLDRDSNVRDGISQRWQRVYFKDLRKEEDQTKDEDTERKKKVAEVSNESLSKMLKCSADQIKQE